MKNVAPYISYFGGFQDWKAFNIRNVGPYISYFDVFQGRENRQNTKCSPLHFSFYWEKGWA